MNDRLIEIFFEVSKIDGISGNEKGISEYILLFLGNLGYQPYIDNTTDKTGSNTGNVICKIGSGGNSILTAHMDTVKSTSQLKHKIEDGAIKSDGTTILGADNRAGVSVLLYTLEKIKKEKVSVNGFIVGFTTCEETTLNGSRFIELPPEIKNGYVFDSSFRPGNIVCQTPGQLCFTINVQGRAAHSGITPEKGINSIQIAANAISQIKLGRVDSETTVNIGIMKGGSAVNVVPELTTLEGEVRSTNPDKAQNVFNSISSIFEKEAGKLGGSVAIILGWDFRPYKISAEMEIYQKTSDAVSRAGLKPEPVLSFGGSDANSFNERGISSVDIGIGAQNPHGNDEFILIEDLEKSADIAFELIKQF